MSERFDPVRVHRVLERFASNSARSSDSIGSVLATTSVEILGIAGAGITIHSAEGHVYSFGVSGPDMAAIHELEVLLREGPCIEAFRTAKRASEPDLANPVDDRWPAFRMEALQTAARAAYGYPLQAADSCVGALNLFETRSGALTLDQHRDALVLAKLSTFVVLTELTPLSEALTLAELGDLFHDQIDVHRAAGMISVQTGNSIEDALARLRARAFADGRPITAVAADVLTRQVRFER